MTKKDYVIITRALSEQRPREHALKASHNLFKKIVGSLALALQVDNPRFDTERFIQACYGHEQ